MPLFVVLDIDNGQPLLIIFAFLWKILMNFYISRRS